MTGTDTTRASREKIFETLRQKLGVTGDDTIRQTAVSDRIDAHPRGLIPERAKRPKRARIDQFVTEIERTSATVSRISVAAEIPGEIASYLRAHNLPARIRLGEDPAFKALDWERTHGLSVDHGPAEADDLVGVSHAKSAAAETGTLFLVSGNDNPTTLSFLPEHHIVVVTAGTIDGAYEDGLDRLRRGGKKLPRAVNLITGPSRTSDIEQKIEFGAHGPKYQHVIIVG